MGSNSQSISASNSIEHANHNRDACNCLLSANKYGDWVVTTSFYASLHYVRALAFPGSMDDLKGKDGKKIRFNNFDDYKAEFYKNAKKENNSAKKEQSPHDLMVRVARSVLNDDEFGYYCGLREASSKSRYTNYETSQLKAITCKTYMDDIAKYVLSKIGKT